MDAAVRSRFVGGPFHRGYSSSKEGATSAQMAILVITKPKLRSTSISTERALCVCPGGWGPWFIFFMSTATLFSSASTLSLEGLHYRGGRRPPGAPVLCELFQVVWGGTLHHLTVAFRFKAPLLSADRPLTRSKFALKNCATKVYISVCLYRPWVRRSRLSSKTVDMTHPSKITLDNLSGGTKAVCTLKEWDAKDSVQASHPDSKYSFADSDHCNDAIKEGKRYQARKCNRCSQCSKMNRGCCLDRRSYSSNLEGDEAHRLGQHINNIRLPSIYLLSLSPS